MKNEIEWRYRLKPQNLRSLSREIDIKLCQNYTKTYLCKILYKIRNIKQIIFNKYATNLKTTISQRSLRNSGVFLLLFVFNNFLILIDIIDKIIYTSGPFHQHPNQRQCSIIVTCLRLYHVTHKLHCHWRECWSRETDVYLTYIRFGIILTQFYVNFSRQEH